MYSISMYNLANIICLDWLNKALHKIRQIGMHCKPRLHVITMTTINTTNKNSCFNHMKFGKHDMSYEQSSPLLMAAS